MYFFRCSNGHCIPAILKCNGKMDCPDNSDEEECDLHVGCSIYEFHCNSSLHCIPL